VKKKRSGGYTAAHARSGVAVPLPPIEAFPAEYRSGYEIRIEIPEYTAICPKTGLPDFGTITIRYAPRASCIELKSLKLYVGGYRNLGIFYENAVNRILRDVVSACHPRWCVVRGDFTPRGGMRTSVEARYPASR